MSAVTGATAVTAKVRCAPTRAASKKNTTSKCHASFPRPRNPTTESTFVSLRNAALTFGAVSANLLVTGTARADDGDGTVGLLFLLVPVAGYLAFNAVKGKSDADDDDDDPPPTTKSQDSKNYAKNLTIAGGQSRKRRTPPKPRNL